MAEQTQQYMPACMQLHEQATVTVLFMHACSFVSCCARLSVLLQSNSRFMMLVDDLLRPESLPRGWSSQFNAGEGKW